MRTHPVLKLVNSALVDLPSPSNLSYMWNLGSLLGICLGLQIVTGVMVSAHYCSDLSLAFESVSHLSRDVNYGWLMRTMHANGASLLFVCLYLHVARGLYYSSFVLGLPWMAGTVLLFMMMATAFLGYVLPWGQMSFWGATVITNLFSAIPFLGLDVVTWLWGGFAVDQATLSRFYSFHFMLPFLVLATVGVHLLALHETGSGNPLGLGSGYDKIPFLPYFVYKDLLGGLGLGVLLSGVVIYMPWYFGDPENFLSANPLVTPLHIQPEWYFLFAYAILRSIPNKLGGVVALAMSVALIAIMPHTGVKVFKGSKFYFLSKYLMWSFFLIVILLTWIGARPVEAPYILVGQALTVLYFFFYGLVSTSLNTKYLLH